MSSEMVLVIVGAAIVVVLLVIAAFALMTRRATSGPQPVPESEKWVAEAKIEAGERPSALVSEEIEELARAKLVAYPDLARAKLDFATATDGSLEISVDEIHYRSVDEVPDERLRRAIQAAVQEWNTRKGG